MDRTMRDFDRWFGTSSVPRYSSSTGDRYLRTRLRNDIEPFSGRSTFDNLHGSTFSRVGPVHHKPSVHSYYETTAESTQGQGGVRQTRKIERDQHTGLQRVAIGHQMYDKDCFQQEWKEKTQCFPQSIEYDKHIHPTKHIHHKKEPKKIDHREYKRYNLGRYRPRRYYGRHWDDYSDSDDDSYSDEDRHDGRYQ